MRKRTVSADPKARARSHQLMAASLLSSSLAGLLLVLAMDDPGNPVRWAVLAGWIVFAVSGNIYAWRRYYREYPPEPWPGSTRPRNGDAGREAVIDDGLSGHPDGESDEPEEPRR